MPYTRCPVLVLLCDRVLFITPLYPSGVCGWGAGGASVRVERRPPVAPPPVSALAEAPHAVQTSWA